MTKEITVKGVEFKVEGYGSVVREFNDAEGIIWESQFPSKRYRNPDHFIGHVIATRVFEQQPSIRRISV